MIQTMDVKSTFRHLGVDPAGAVNFGHVLGDHLFIDLRLQFVWRGSPGWRGVLDNAIQKANRQTTRESATIMGAGMEAAAHVRVAEHTGVETGPLPESCTVKTVEGAGAEDTAWGNFLQGRCIAVRRTGGTRRGEIKASGTGVRSGNGKNDDITASPEGQGAAEAVGGVARGEVHGDCTCLLYTSPSPRDKRQSRMPSSA